MSPLECGVCGTMKGAKSYAKYYTCNIPQECHLNSICLKCAKWLCQRLLTKSVDDLEQMVLLSQRKSLKRLKIDDELLKSNID